MLVHLWFVTLALAVVGVQRGLCSIKCYSCLSKEPRDACERLDKKQIPLKTCNLDELGHTANNVKEIDEKIAKFYEVHGHQEPLMPLNCLKQVIQKGDKLYTLRGCQLATGDALDICVKMKNENTDFLKTNYCSLCNGNGCNAASVRRPVLPVLGIVCLAFLIRPHM